jgi:hypothetical protein
VRHLRQASLPQATSVPSCTAVRTIGDHGARHGCNVSQKEAAAALLVPAYSRGSRSNLRKSRHGVAPERLNEHLEHDWGLTFQHACDGAGGIVSKRLGSSARLAFKFKNPQAPAVRREDWGARRADAYSISSSATESKYGESARPSCLAVFWLITN